MDERKKPKANKRPNNKNHVPTTIGSVALQDLPQNTTHKLASIQQLIKNIEHAQLPQFSEQASLQAVIGYCLELGRKFDTKILLKYSIASLFLKEKDHCETCTHQLLKLTSQQEFDGFIEAIAQHTKGPEAFRECLTQITSKTPHERSLLLHILENMDPILLVGLFTELQTTDALTLRYISKILALLPSGAPDTYLLQTYALTESFSRALNRVDSYFIGASLDTPDTLLVRLIVLKILSSTPNLLTAKNISRLFNLENCIKNRHQASAIHQLFMQLIEAYDAKNLTQGFLDELLNHLENYQPGKIPSLTNPSIQTIEKHFNLHIEPAIAENYEKLGKNWWAHAFYSYFPESLPKKLKGQGMLLEVTQKALSPIASLKVCEISSFFDCVDLLHTQGRSLLMNDQTGLACFSHLVTLAGQYQLSHLYPVLMRLERAHDKRKITDFAEPTRALIAQLSQYDNTRTITQYLKLFSLLPKKTTDSGVLRDSHLKALSHLQARPDAIVLFIKILENTKGSRYLRENYGALAQQSDRYLAYVYDIILLLAQDKHSRENMYDAPLTQILHKQGIDSKALVGEDTLQLHIAYLTLSESTTNLFSKDLFSKNTDTYRGIRATLKNLLLCMSEVSQDPSSDALRDCEHPVNIPIQSLIEQSLQLAKTPTLDSTRKLISVISTVISEDAFSEKQADSKLLAMPGSFFSAVPTLNKIVTPLKAAHSELQRLAVLIAQKNHKSLRKQHHSRVTW